MKKCRQCGMGVSSTESYCPRCGSGKLVLYEGGEAQQQKEQPKQEDKIAQSANSGQERPVTGEIRSEMHNKSTNDGVVTLKEWLVTYLLLLIPFYNIYKLIKIVVGGPSIKRSITNLFRASLVMSVIMAVLILLGSLIMGILAASALSFL